MALEVGDGGNPLKFTAVIDYSNADKSLDSFYKKMSDKAREHEKSISASDALSGVAQRQQEYTRRQSDLLQKMSSQYRSTMSEAVSAFDAMDRSAQNNYNTLVSLQRQSKTLSAAQKDLDNSLKSGSITQKQYVEGTRALALQQTTIRQRISETNTLIRQQEQSERRVIGSLAEKSARLTQLRQEYNKLSEAQRNNINVGGRIQQEYRKVSEEVRNLNTQLTGVKSGQNGIGSIFSSLRGIAGTLGIAFGVQQLVSFGNQLFEIAKQAEGVQLAFRRLDGDATKNIDNLRKATKGTVSDLELMKLAVRAENFSIPMDVLAKGLAFARQRANDTGQSVDYLVNSFVDGLGRQSKLVLDNLGISAKDLSNEIERTGDFATATGNIIDRIMANSGDSVDTLADRVDKVNARWENLKLTTANYFKALMHDLTAVVTSESWSELFTGLGKLLTYLNPNQVTSTIDRSYLDTSLATSGKKGNDSGLVPYKDMRDFYKSSADQQAKMLERQREIVGLRREEYRKDKESVKVRDEMLYQEEKLAKMISKIGLANKANNKGLNDQLGLIQKAKKEIEDLEGLREKSNDKGEIAAINKKIEAKRKELITLEGGKSSPKKTDEERKAEELKKQIKKDEESYNKLLKEIGSAGGKYSDEIISREQQEINSVISYYDTLIEKAKEYNKVTKFDKQIDISAIETEKGFAVNRVNERQNKEDADKQAKEVEKKQQELYKNMLQLAKNNEDEIISIRKKYQEAYQALEKDKTNITVEEFERRKEALKKNQSDEIGNILLPDLKKSGDWATVFENSANTARTMVFQSVKNLKDSLKKMLNEGEITIEQYNEYLKQIGDVEIKVSVSERGFGRIKQVLKDLEKAEKGSQVYDEARQKLGSEINYWGQGLADAGREALNVADQLGIGSEKFKEDMALSMNLVSDASNLAASIASGDVVGMVVNGIKTISSAIALFTKDRKIERQIKEYQKQLDQLGKTYDELAKKMGYSDTNYYANAEAQLKNLEAQKKQVEQMMAAEDSKKKTDKDKMKSYEDQLKSIQTAREELENSIRQMRLQTDINSLAQSITDALTGAFEAGEDGIDAMDKAFDKFIKNSLANSARLKFVQGIIETMLTDVDKYMAKNGNSLVGYDFSSWQEKLSNAGKEVFDFLESAYAGLGLDKESSDSSSTISGKIKKELTEKTGGEIVGIFRAGYDVWKQQLVAIQAQSATNVNILAIANEKLIALNAIQANTANTVSELKNAVVELKAINKNTSKTGRSAEGMGL